MLIFLPIHQCVLALYTQYFPESCEKNITGMLLRWDIWFVNTSNIYDHKNLLHVFLVRNTAAVDST